MRDGLPSAIKVFIWALLGGLGTGYAAFRVVFFLAQRYPRHPEIVGFGLLVAAFVGVAGAVTAGVIAGKRVRS